MSRSSETLLLDIVFAGKLFDRDTGLAYYEGRWYDPATGRFVSVDPSGLGPDSNPYRYVHNSPTNYIDPDGREAVPVNPVPQPPPIMRGDQPTDGGAAAGKILPMLDDLERIRGGDFRNYEEYQLYLGLLDDPYPNYEPPPEVPEPSCRILPDYGRMDPVELQQLYLQQLQEMGPGSVWLSPGGLGEAALAVLGSGRPGTFVNPGMMGRPRPKPPVPPKPPKPPKPGPGPEPPQPPKPGPPIQGPEPGPTTGGGTIYVVPGSGTPSGKPYIGRHNQPDPAKTRRSSDGRDRSQAKVIDTYDPCDISEGRVKEQNAIDSHGGVGKLDNRRNEIAPKPFIDRRLYDPTQ